MLYLGCHLSATGGNLAMVRTAREMNANTFAFFTRNPRGSKAKKEDPADCAAAMAALSEYQFGPLVAHGAYTMNLCTADAEARAFAAEVLADDLRRMSYLPGQFYNFHPGSHVGQGVEAAVEQISAALKQALSPGYPVTVLLETMAGKGSEVGGRFEELKLILDAVGSPDMGVCLDTCHVLGQNAVLRIPTCKQKPLGNLTCRDAPCHLPKRHERMTKRKSRAYRIPVGIDVKQYKYALGRDQSFRHVVLAQRHKALRIIKHYPLHRPRRDLLS